MKETKGANTLSHTIKDPGYHGSMIIDKQYFTDRSLSGRGGGMGRTTLFQSQVDLYHHKIN